MSLEQLNSWAESLFGILARASWQGAFAALLVWGVCAAFRRMPPVLKAWLWRLVVLKFIVALAWFQPIELGVIPAEQRVVADALGAADIAAPAILSGTTVDVSESIANGPVADGISQSDISSSAPVESSIWARLQGLGWQAIVVWIWAGGVTVGFGVLARQFVAAVRLRRGTKRCEQVSHLLIAMSRAIGLVRVPLFCTSLDVKRPMLIGSIRPALVFPEALVANGTQDSLRMMIAHEVAHIRRLDLVWSVVAAAAQALFFFHPLVWLSRRELLLAQEIACDELALKATGAPAERYAEMLVDVVSLPTKETVVLSLGIAESRKTLERRIRSMKLYPQKSKWMQWVGFAVLVGALLVLAPIRLVAAKTENPNQTFSGVVALSHPDAGAVLDQLKDAPRNELRNIMPTLVRDRLLNRHLQAYAENERELSALKTQYSDEHPKVRDAVQVLATIDKQVEDRIDGILAGLEAIQMAQNSAGQNRKLARENTFELAESSRTSLEEERKLMDMEAEHLRREISIMEQRLTNGRESQDALLKLQRELRAVEMERAQLLNDAAAEKKALQQQIELTEQLLAREQQRIDVGRGDASNTRLQRELLRLKRDLARMESGRRGASGDAAGGQNPMTRSDVLQMFAVHARTEGAVESVMAKVGDKVTAGQKLVAMDSSAAQGKLRSAEARAKIAEADLQIAKAQLEDAQRRYESRKRAFDQGAAPLDSLPNLEVSKANVTKAEAQYELALIDRDQAANELQNYTLLSPVDGTIKWIIHEKYWAPEQGKILVQIEAVESGTGADKAAISTLEKELEHARSEHKDLLLKYRPTHPLVQANQKKIMALQERLGLLEHEPDK